MATPEPTWEQTNPQAWIYRESGDTHCFGFVVRDEDTFSALLMLPSPERVRPTHDLGDFATLPAAQRQVEAAHSYLTDIAKALATQGGHLSIGRGGFTLHYENCRLSGYDETLVLALARLRGLPIIDTRTIPDDDIVVTSIRAPLPAVNREPDPEPYHGLAYAPLVYLAAHYAQAGARVENLPLNQAQAGA